jgi:hypothetical protein
MTKRQSVNASSNVSVTRADANISSAPDARAVASGPGKHDGDTKVNKDRPMFFMARAAAPMFPGWVGFTSTIRSDSIGVRM